MNYAPPPKYAEIADPDLTVTEAWQNWFIQVGRGVATLQTASAAGYSGTIPLAKITGGGADGSITVVNGLITAATAPT